MGYFMGLIAAACLCWALVERRRADKAALKAALEKVRGDTLAEVSKERFNSHYRLGECDEFLRDFIAHPHSREHLAKAKELLEKING